MIVNNGSTYTKFSWATILIFVLTILLIFALITTFTQNEKECTKLECELLNKTKMLWYTWYKGTSYYFNENTTKNVLIDDIVNCHLEKHNVSLGKC